jgi:hypothetical protein
MNKNSILLIDPNFEPANSSNLNLLVKVGVDTFSYSIADEEKELIHAVYDEQECEDGVEKFKERLKIDAYLKLPYKSVKAAIYTQNSVLVPKSLFDEAQVKLYTQFFVDTDLQNIYVQSSEQQEFIRIFGVPSATEKLLTATWENVTLLPHDAGLLENLPTKENNNVIIDFTVGSFQLLYFKEKLLNFAQNYEFDGIDELTYYLLLIISQLSINTKQTALKVCGIIHQGDDKWNLLAQHFNEIDFLVTPTPFDTNILDDMPAHYYTSLLALQKCG